MNKAFKIIFLKIMNKNWVYILMIINTYGINAQINIDSLENSNKIIIAGDTISKIKDTIFLDEVHISKLKMSEEDKKQFLLLQNRVYKTYPYAKIAADKLTAINKSIQKLNNPKDKKKYFKIAEEFLNIEFKQKLKSLSHKQGQILVKLIHRQTGKTTFELIKEYKSGWKAFWSNNTAKLFEINLKEQYLPFDDNEDFLIETILHRAFFNQRLVEQKPAKTIDFYQLNDSWEQKAKK